MFFNAYVLFGLRLFALQTEGQKYTQKTLQKSYKSEIKIFANPTLA